MFDCFKLVSVIPLSLGIKPLQLFACLFVFYY